MGLERLARLPASLTRRGPMMKQQDGRSIGQMTEWAYGIRSVPGDGDPSRFTIRIHEDMGAMHGERSDTSDLDVRS